MQCYALNAWFYILTEVLKMQCYASWMPTLSCLLQPQHRVLGVTSHLSVFRVSPESALKAWKEKHGSCIQHHCHDLHQHNFTPEMQCLANSNLCWRRWGAILSVHRRKNLFPFTMYTWASFDKLSPEGLVNRIVHTYENVGYERGREFSKCYLLLAVWVKDSYW